MSQHITRIQAIEGKANNDRYIARCSCGWHSHEYAEKRLASDDADEHVRQMVHAEAETAPRLKREGQAE